jgi:hypothetical protein
MSAVPEKENLPFLEHADVERKGIVFASAGALTAGRVIKYAYSAST